MESKNLYDVIVIGGGPAGLTAALYLARAQYRVLVLEKESFGGQIKITSEVVNYPGVLRTDGHDLTDVMRRQAENFGAEFLLAEAESIEAEGQIKTVKTSRGELQALGLLIATGANPRMLGFKGEEEYKGRGVAYCATCDGEFFTDKEVLVIGGGFAAAEESVFLTKYAKKVTVLVRKDAFSCAASTAEETLNHPKITVKFHTELLEVGGENDIRTALLYNNETGEKEEYRAENGDSFGVFVFAGYVPASGLVKGIVDLDERGYIITDRSQKTSVEGVYAAGDICIKPLRQVVTAVSDGAVAATELEKHVSAMHRATGLHPERPQAVLEAVKHAKENSREIAKEETVESASGGGFLNEDIRAQLKGLAERFERGLELKVYKDARPVSDELEGAMRELAELSDKFKLSIKKAAEAEDEMPSVERPAVVIAGQNGENTGLAFHGVPGGHEFQSFVIGLYNAAGPGQALDADLSARIGKLSGIDMKILVSLSCTQCPELVMACQRIAAANAGITAHVFDLNHYEALKEKYQVMSVPCLVINDGAKVSFGKKNIVQVLDILENL